MSDTIANDEELQITAPEHSLPPCALEDLPEKVQLACARAGWTRLMPVQAHALPYLMAGRDIMVQSRTGSGKTGAYLLPLLSLLDPEEKKPQALILAPTRELASQVEHEARTLFEGTGLSVTSLYGGEATAASLRLCTPVCRSSWARPAVCSIIFCAALFLWMLFARSSSTRPTACSPSASIPI